MDDKEILGQVYREFTTASKKWPAFNSMHEGFAVLKEEVDELWEVLRMNQDLPGRIVRAREEAIQVAAMALRFLKDCC